MRRRGARTGWIVAATLHLAACAPAPVEVALTPDPPRAPRQVATAAPSGLPAAPEPDASASASAAPAAPPVRPASTKGMVLLPGGTFTTKQYRRTATVASFWLDVTEATAGAYRTCVLAGKCSEEDLVCKKNDYVIPASTYRRPSKEEHPINCVNQAQAMAYCAFVGKRLPNDAEWEWAARGTTRGSTYPWGEDKPTTQLCWKRFDASTARNQGTCRVGSFPRDRTPQGIMDMAGNVQEWATSIRPGDVVVHGVDWAETNPDYVAVGVDSHVEPRARGPGIGFRCAADGPAASP